jgi:hypothetical protein
LPGHHQIIQTGDLQGICVQSKNSQNIQGNTLERHVTVENHVLPTSLTSKLSIKMKSKVQNWQKLKILCQVLTKMWKKQNFFEFTDFFTYSCSGIILRNSYLSYKEPSSTVVLLLFYFIFEVGSHYII